MQVKEFIKSSIKYVLTSVAPKTQVYPQIVTLGINELLKGRTALITGGTSGIGFEIAKHFVNAGATVIITGRNEEKTKAAALKINEETVTDHAYAIQLDNRNVAEFDDKLQQAIKIVGKPIDILVNNAGVLGCDFVDGKEDDYDAVMETNLKGVFFLSQKVAHYMKDNHIEGNILNVASSSSLRPVASAYTLSKWGIRGLTLGMARMMAPLGIVVNGIAPGPTATPMLMPKGVNSDISLKTNLTGRFALPEEIANMSVILVSNMSRMIIGDIIYMTGGAGLLTNDEIDYTFK